MRLRVKNVGILSDSEIEIAGITVVAGENNTGKSTFGKALYSVFSALNQLESQVEWIKRQSAANVARVSFTKIKKLSSENWLDSIVSKLYDNKLTLDLIDEIVESCPNDFIDGVDDFSKKAKEILSTDDADIQKRLVLAAFNGEFRNQVQNQLNRDVDSQVNLIIKNKNITVNIRNESIESVSGIVDLDHTPVYIDDLTSSLGSNRLSIYSRYAFSYRHNVNLYGLINKNLANEVDVIQGILTDQLLKPVQDRLYEICHGSLRHVEKEIKFVDEKMPGVQLDLVNVSAGLKTFLILQELIRNGAICENGTVIMDEPEIHLHPKWQVVLAELIVMLQKAMKLHILITSHSPYFISALDVFSKKHKVIENNRYYFNSREGNVVKVEDVTESIYVIYDSLAEPYQDIQDEAMELQI